MTRRYWIAGLGILFLGGMPGCGKEEESDDDPKPPPLSKRIPPRPDKSNKDKRTSKDKDKPEQNNPAKN